MSKIKMRCINCGKWFQSANAKEVTCPDCTLKLRKEKQAAKSMPAASGPSGATPPKTAPPRPHIPPPPKPANQPRGTVHWLDSLNDVKVGEPEQPARPKPPVAPPPDPRERYSPGYRSPDIQRGPGGYRDQRGPYREGERDQRGPGAYREGDRGQRGPGAYRDRTGVAPTGPRPRQPMDAVIINRGPRPGPGERGKPVNKYPKPANPKPPRPKQPPKPKREKIPPPTPFVPSPEQVMAIETRYKELATPIEFDGIRTQIATELSIPKSAIKRVIKDLRDRESLPSWWEMQVYKGTGEELEKIKSLYEPYLTLPPVGIHKEIAEKLSLKATQVYQAIKTIRHELNLPQYNDPSLHAEELTARQASRDNSQQTGEVSTSPAAETPAEIPVPAPIPGTEAATQAAEVAVVEQHSAAE